MTRQRIRPSLKRSVFKDCPCCGGRSVVKTAESMAIEVVRLLMFARQQRDVARVTVRVNDEVASYLNNKKRRELAELRHSYVLVSELHDEATARSGAAERELKSERRKRVPAGRLAATCVIEEAVSGMRLCWCV